MTMRADCEAYVSTAADLSDLLAMEDRAGIEKVVLIATVGYRPDNRAVAECGRESDRIIPCACVNPRLGDEATAELERCLGEDGMGGLKLMSANHGYVISSGVADDCVEIARSHGVPVTVHSQGTPSHPLEIGVLAQRFPDVPFIMDHLGHRYWRGQAIDAARQAENLFLGTCIAAFEPGSVRDAIDALGPERVVFGTNAPSAHPDLAVESIVRLGLPEDQFDLVMGGNLARIYRL